MFEMNVSDFDRQIRREQRFLDNLGKRTVVRAARLATNDSASKARTAASKEIRALWNLKAKDVNAQVKVVKRASGSDLIAIVQGRGKPVNLMKFKGTKAVKSRGRGTKGKGVAVTIQRGRRQRLPHAFIAKVTAGKSSENIGVFQRVGKQRLPIVNKASITMASMFGQDNVTTVMVRTVDVTWQIRFNHHMARLLK